MYVLIFRFPNENDLLRLKINRLLKNTNAKKFQNSVWFSDNLPKLIEIASFIKNRGGKAIILEKKALFE